MRHQRCANFQKTDHNVRPPDAFSETEHPGRDREKNAADEIQHQMRFEGDHLEEPKLISGEDAIEDRDDAENNRDPVLWSAVLESKYPRSKNEEYADEVIEYAVHTSRNEAHGRSC